VNSSLGGDLVGRVDVCGAGDWRSGWRGGGEVMGYSLILCWLYGDAKSAANFYFL